MNGELEIKSCSDFEIIHQENGKSFIALLVSLKVKLKCNQILDWFTDFDDNENIKEIPFYCLVQIVDKEIRDTALSEDSTNEYWLDIKSRYSEHVISSLKSKIKDIFQQYLKESEFVA